MVDFDAVITGEREIGARFAEWPKEIHDSLYKRIENLTAQLYARVKASTPQRTGALDEELIKQIYDKPESIEGVVTFPNDLAQQFYAKAGALEYGAHRGGQVQAYRRTITEAFGRAIGPKTIRVRQHSRVPNIEEYSYLRASLAGMEPEIKAELTEAINEVAKD